MFNRLNMQMYDDCQLLIRGKLANKFLSFIYGTVFLMDETRMFKTLSATFAVSLLTFVNKLPVS